MERTKFTPKKKIKKVPRNSVKEENYTIIQGWMITDLNLKGHNLIAYAIIYGFSQDGESKYTGSNSYLGTWLQVSEPTVIKVLKDLVDKKLIIKTPIVIKGVTFNEYAHNKEILVVLKNFKYTTKEILVPPTKEILVNNKILISKDINTKEINKEKFYLEYFSKEWNENKEFQNLLIEYIAHRKEKRSNLTNIAWKRLATTLQKFTLEEACEALEVSIQNGYIGVFPKSYTKSNSKKLLRGGVPAQLTKDHSDYLKPSKYGKQIRIM